MEENKNNKGIIWLIIILTFLLLGLIGFIVYDKLLKVDNKISDYDNTNTTTTTTTVNISKNEIAKFPENDASIDNITLDFINGCKDVEEKKCYSIDNYKNYKQESITDNIKINCDNYDYEIDERSNKFCYISTMIIDNKISHSYKNQWNFGLANIEILKTSKYFIIQEQGTVYGSGKIVIYDYDGNKVKELNNTITSATIIDENFSNDFKENVFNIKINDNNLYYAYKEKENHDCDEDNYLHLGYIDLENEFKNIEIQKVKAITNHEC